MTKDGCEAGPKTCFPNFPPDRDAGDEGRQGQEAAGLPRGHQTLLQPGHQHNCQGKKNSDFTTCIQIRHAYRMIFVSVSHGPGQTQNACQSVTK